MRLFTSSLGTAIVSATLVAGPLVVPSVTVVVAVQDSRGDFIPNLRPEKQL